MVNKDGYKITQTLTECQVIFRSFFTGGNFVVRQERVRLITAALHRLID